MNFMHLNWLPVVILATILMSFSVLYYERWYFKWIKKYWFFRPSKISILRRIFYLLGISCLLLSLLDLRGPEEQIDTKVSDQKTIIIMDTSASMLVEDVRPNRFKKSILMARHFIKKAIGHKIALVLFSDIQRKIVPFTDDVDLLDHRVEGLKNAQIQNGGSNLTQALVESVQYLKADGGSNVAIGNILLFTDSEEHSANIKLDIPDTITLGIVGIGTLNGGPIPLRNDRGVFVGHKKHLGKDIISKLNEQNLKDIVKKVKNAHYWIASTYTIPTEEILQFFKNSYLDKTYIDKIRIRPIEAKYLIIPGIILMSLSYLMGMFPTFVTTMLVLLMGIDCFVCESTYAQDAQDGHTQDLASDSRIKDLQEKHKRGQTNNADNLALAERLLKAKEYDKAITLYRENLGLDEAHPTALMNFAVALAKNKQIPEALKIFAHVAKKLRSDKYPELNDQDLRQNVLTALYAQQQQAAQKDKKRQNKQGQGQGQQGEGERQQNKEGEGPLEKNQKGGDSNDNQGQEHKDGQGKGEGQENNSDNTLRQASKSEDKLDGEEPQLDLGDTDKQKSKKLADGSIKQQSTGQGKRHKLPAIIKEILNSDGKLQKKFIDTSTSSGYQHNRKDW